MSCQKPALEVGVAGRDRVGADALGRKLAAEPGGIVNQRRLEDAVGPGGEVDLDTRDTRNHHDGARVRLLQMRSAASTAWTVCIMSTLNSFCQDSRSGLAASALTLGTTISSPPNSAATSSTHWRTAGPSPTSSVRPRGAHAGRGKRGDRLLHIGLGARADRDIGALRRKLVRDRAADPLGAAGHQRLPALQSEIHVSLPRYRHRMARRISYPPWQTQTIVALPGSALRGMVTDRRYQGQRHSPAAPSTPRRLVPGSIRPDPIHRRATLAWIRGA